MTDSTRGAHPDEPAEGGREQGEEAEERVRERMRDEANRDPDPDDSATP